MKYYKCTNLKPLQNLILRIYAKKKDLKFNGEPPGNEFNKNNFCFIKEWDDSLSIGRFDLDARIVDIGIEISFLEMFKFLTKL